jgi:hypothetical protein
MEEPRFFQLCSSRGAACLAEFELPARFAGLRFGQEIGLIGLGRDYTVEWTKDRQFYRVLAHFALEAPASPARAEPSLRRTPGSAAPLLLSEEGGGESLVLYNGAAGAIYVLGHEAPENKKTADALPPGACPAGGRPCRGPKIARAVYDSVILAPPNLVALGAELNDKNAYRFLLELAPQYNLANLPRFSPPRLMVVRLGPAPTKAELEFLIDGGHFDFLRLLGEASETVTNFRHELLVHAALADEPGILEWLWESEGRSFNPAALEDAFAFACLLDAGRSALWLSRAAPPGAPLLKRAAALAARGAAARTLSWLLATFDVRASLGDLFLAACGGGAPDNLETLAVVQELFDDFGSASFPAEAFLAAARSGHTALVELLLRRELPGDRYAALLAACAAGHVETAMTLRPHVASVRESSCGGSFRPISRAAPIGKPVETFALLCERGLRDAAAWLASAFDLAPDDVRATALRAACLGGDLETARWLVTKFGLSTIDGGSAALEALASGETPVAQWLITALRVPVPSLTTAEAGALFTRACATGSYLSVRLLVKYLSLDVEALVPPEARVALVFGGTGGQLELAVWLAGALELTGEQPRWFVPGLWVNGYLALAEWALRTHGERGLFDDEGEPNAALRLAAESGRAETVRWLLANWLPRLSLGAVGPGVFAEVCAKGFFEIARALASAFPREDFASVLAQALSRALLGGHLEIALWLRESFGPVTTPDIYEEIEARGYYDAAAWLAGL